MRTVAFGFTTLVILLALTGNVQATSTRKLYGAQIINSGTLTLPTSTDTLVGRATTDALTNKDIDGGTASNSSRITLPKASTATLSGLTRKQGNIFYDTTLNGVVFDDGSSVTQLASGGGAPAYWFGYQKNDCIWSTTSTTYTDAAADASCTCVEVSNSGMGTVSTDAANCTTGAGTSGSRTMQIKFTPPRTGAYLIKAAVSNGTNSGSQNCGLLMTDGSNNVIGSELNYNTNGGALGGVSGILVVGSISAQTIKLRVASASGASSCTYGVNVAAFSIENLSWTITELR